MGLESLAQDRIGRLRLRVPAGHALQPPPELRALELHPSGLARSAIVVLRSLRLVRRGAAAGARALPVSAWRDATHGAVNAALRNAARPIDGAVPGRCDAVVFADLAELLACLARDWLDGTVASHWWWREVFRQTPTPATVCAAWLDNEPALAAAVALLRAEGRLTAFVALWPAHERARLRSLRAADLDFDRAPASESGHEPSTTAGEPTSATRGIVVGPPSSGVQSTRAPFATRPLSRPPLPPISEVQTTPVREIVARGVAPPVAGAPGRAANSGGRGDEGGADASAAGTATAPPLTAPAHAAPGSASASPPVASRPEPVVLAVASEAVATRDGRVAATPAPAAPEARAIEPETAESEARAAPPRTATPVRPFAPRFESSSLQTGFGGLFYLLNVTLHLGLYPDFTQPRSAGLALSPWDLLAWIGRRWFGRAFERDPLSAALAAWAGRAPGDEPAADFVAPAPWQVPNAWLLPFGRAAALKLRRAGGRRLLQHPAGFSVFDLDDAAAVSLPALDGVAIVDLPPRRSAPAFASEGQRWLAHLARLVRARCAIALQVPRRDVPALVARHPSLVVTTPATLEVRLSLAGLPLAVRIAGLDRDPGWLPAAGRSLRFVFD